MSKVLVIPDSHTKIEVIEEGMEVAEKIHADHVVLLGDYFDDFGATTEKQENMLAYLKDFLVHHTNVIPLYGNHELSYLGFPCSGHMRSVEEKLMKALKYDYRFLYAVSFDGVLYTHAGVTQSWLRDSKVMTENAIRYKLKTGAGAKTLEEEINGVKDISVFSQVGYARGGSTDAPSPLWADLRELINDPLPNIRQVVGHTPISQIECIGNCWFCDTRSNGNQNDEFLVVTDGEPSIVKYSEAVV